MQTLTCTKKTFKHFIAIFKWNNLLIPVSMIDNWNGKDESSEEEDSNNNHTKEIYKKVRKALNTISIMNTSRNK